MTDAGPGAGPAHHFHRHPEREKTFDQELLSWLGDEPAEKRRRDAQLLRTIAGEFAKGFDSLAGIGPAVTFFGSARTPPEHPDYQLVRGVARTLGEAGYAVITGGGPGLMEAANRGAWESGATSVACNIELPQERSENRYANLSVRFRHLFARKVMFVRYACAFVIAPGGYGTYDELFETLTLIQTGTIAQFPAILLGDGEWEGLIEWLNARAVADGRLDPGDVSGLHVTSDPRQVLEIIDAAARRSGTSDAGG